MSGRPAGWGRWGTADEIGALNLATDDRTLAAVALVRQGRVISLSQPLAPAGNGAAPHRAPNARYMTRDAGDYALGARSPGGFRFAEDVVLLSTHNGTHVDALCHTWAGDELYNGHPASDIRSTSGAKHLGAETLRPALARGVLFDFVRANGGPLAPSTRIDGADLAELAAAQGVEPGPGDVVLLRTGWWGAAEGEDYWDLEPGITPDAALWLAERDIIMVGADNYAVEVQPSAPGEAFPVHLALIHQRGIPILENLDLDALGESGRHEFLFVFAPLPLTGSTAAPLNPLAVV